MRAHRRIAGLAPDVAAAILRAFQQLRDSMSEAEIARLIAEGLIESVVQQIVARTILDAAFLPVRERLRITTRRGFEFATQTLPGGGKIGGTVTVAFDTLSPDVVTALRTLNTRVLATLTEQTREVVRSAIERGLQQGQSARTIAKGLREVIGLGPTQWQEVQNFRAALEGKDGRNPFTYESRDRRYDAMLKKLRADGKSLSPAQIDKMVAAYQKKRIAINANTVARTATVDAFKAGQRLSWQQAIDAGLVDRDRLKHQWIGVNDDRERPAHVKMNNEVQPFDVPYSNGQMVPGESEYNCRCLDRFFIARAA